MHVSGEDVANLFVGKGEATMGHDLGLHPCCEFGAQIAQSGAETQSESLVGKFAWEAFAMILPFSFHRPAS